ncbi:MAG: hypothetical protein WBK28_00485 [Minisyncoccia bacterium]
MRRTLALLVALLIPLSAGAATLRADTTLTLSESLSGNAYLAASTLSITAPLPGDLVAAAGTLEVSAPIAGDTLLLAGVADFKAPLAGDVRIAAGRLSMSAEVTGELAALAHRLIITGKVGEVRAAGGTVELVGGAHGPVTIYGENVTLGGEFSENVRVIASGQVSLQEGTLIHGVFEYNAPQEASIPEGARVDGGVRYIGSASFLPTAEEAKTFALAGIGIFFLVRLVAAMLAAGLLTGLFPEFARRIVHESIGRSPRRFLLLALLGFATVVATPVLILLLLASFVGIGIAALIGALYVLMLMLTFLYAGVIAGSVFARVLLKRPGVSWRSAAFGILILYLLGLMPLVGLLAYFVLASAALGAMLVTFHRFALGRGEGA